VIDRPGVSLIGDDRDSILIVHDDSAIRLLPSGEAMHTFNTSTLYVGGTDFSAENLSIVNSAGPGKAAGQAIACYVDADRASFSRCSFRGFQDTLCLGPLPSNPLPKDINTLHPVAVADPEGRKPLFRHAFKACRIEGDIDFIFGSSTAFFLDCDLSSRRMEEGTKGYITSPSTLPGQTYGFVFLGCKAGGDAVADSVFLGRPWRATAQCAFIDCLLGGHIRAEGWDNWGSSAHESSVMFLESGSKGPGAPDAAKPGGRSRVPWAGSPTLLEKERFSPQRVLSGDDGWDPWDKGS